MENYTVLHELIKKRLYLSYLYTLIIQITMLLSIIIIGVVTYCRITIHFWRIASVKSSEESCCYVRFVISMIDFL